MVHGEALFILSPPPSLSITIPKYLNELTWHIACWLIAMFVCLNLTSIDMIFVLLVFIFWFFPRFPFPYINVFYSSVSLLPHIISSSEKHTRVHFYFHHSFSLHLRIDDSEDVQVLVKSLDEFKFLPIYISDVPWTFIYRYLFCVCHGAVWTNALKIHPVV